MPSTWSCRCRSRLLSPARVGPVELADQGSELELALPSVTLAEALELGVRLAGHVVAHAADRAGGTGIDLGLAGALQAIEADKRLGHRASGGQQAVVAQHHRRLVAEVLDQPRAFVELEAHALVVVVGER